MILGQGWTFLVKGVAVAPRFWAGHLSIERNTPSVNVKMKSHGWQSEPVGQKQKSQCPILSINLKQT